MAAVGTLNLTVEAAKSNFFDRAVVLRRAAQARRKNLSRIGAYVRMRAITLLLRHVVGRGFGAKSKVRDRHKGETAPAGQAPYAHLGDIAKFMFFGWDAITESVVIGPALLNKASSALLELEQGGAATLAFTRRRRGVREQVRRRVQFRPHPFMRPALEDVKEQAPKVWENTIR